MTARYMSLTEICMSSRKMDFFSRIRELNIQSITRSRVSFLLGHGFKKPRLSPAADFPSGGFGGLIPMLPYMVKFSTATSKDALSASGTIGSAVPNTDTGICAHSAVQNVISSASRLRSMIKSTFARNLASDRDLVQKNDITLPL